VWARETIFATSPPRRVGGDGGARPGARGVDPQAGHGAFIGLAAGTGADLVGAAAVAWDPDRAGADGWSERLCGAPCFTIAGGTTEVLKNLVAERVLGLPVT